MKRRVGMLGLVIAFVALFAVTAWSANSVTGENKTVSAGATGVTVGFFVVNDVELTGLVLPLEFRTVDGGFIANSLTLDVQGRVGTSGLMDFQQKGVYGIPAGTCSGPTSSSYNPATSGTANFVSPDCAFWAGVNAMNPNMTVGADEGTPSFLLTFDVTNTPGTQFEIDTCCVTSANHLQFVDDMYAPILPSWTKSVITILPDAVQEVGSGLPVPTEFAIGQNYPNPFNAGTIIPFEVAYDSQVRIDVYDILGRQIATVINDHYPQGRYQADWNGTNRSGQPVATGVYFYRLSAGETVTTRKMVLLK